ncbi:unnamed protein product [Camellia sinensis]
MQLSEQQLAQLANKYLKKETNGRWPPLVADRNNPWLTCHKAGRQVTLLSRQEATSSWSKNNMHNTERFRGSKTRRSTEDFGHSKQTQTRTIVECTNNDVQVLKTVKNGVSRVPSSHSGNYIPLLKS